MTTIAKYQKQIGKLIYSLRWEHRLTLKQLSVKSGHSVLQLRNIENGKVNTSIKTLYNVAKVFGLSPAQFLVKVESKELLAEK